MKDTTLIECSKIRLSEDDLNRFAEAHHFSVHAVELIYTFKIVLYDSTEKKVKLLTDFIKLTGNSCIVYE